jgi:hypothetical protein
MKHNPWENKKASYQYIVRFWNTNQLGFKYQEKVVLYYHSKSNHKDAEKEVIKKYKISKNDIIQVCCD